MKEPSPLDHKIYQARIDLENRKEQFGMGGLYPEILAEMHEDEKQEILKKEIARLSELLVDARWDEAQELLRQLEFYLTQEVIMEHMRNLPPQTEKEMMVRSESPQHAPEQLQDHSDEVNEMLRNYDFEKQFARLVGGDALDYMYHGVALKSLYPEQFNTFEIPEPVWEKLMKEISYDVKSRPMYALKPLYALCTLFPERCTNEMRQNILDWEKVAEDIMDGGTNVISGMRLRYMSAAIQCAPENKKGFFVPDKKMWENIFKFIAEEACCPHYQAYFLGLAHDIQIAADNTLEPIYVSSKQYEKMKAELAVAINRQYPAYMLVEMLHGIKHAQVKD